MTNRYHIPIVVTTADEMRRDELESLLEMILTDEVEQDPEVYRTFIEDTGIDTEDAERLFTMLDRVSDKKIATAVAALDEIRSEENS